MRALASLAVVAIGLSLAAGAALAQQAPLTLPPPSLMNPGDPSAAESGAAKPRAAKRPAKRAAKGAAKPEDGSEAPVRRSARRGEPAFSETPSTQQAKPRRFVPEEFDQGDSTDTSSPRPFMSPSGRAGVGMRF